MDGERKKSKISLSKPEDIPQNQTEYNYDSDYSYQNIEDYHQEQQNEYQRQTIYKEDTARRLPKYNVPNAYQQEHSPIPRNNSPFQNSNYSRMRNSTQNKYCKFCGGTIPFDAVVCTQCGRQVEVLQGNVYQQNNTYINVNNQNFNNISTKNRTVAGVLCALFGWCGLHRFYTGHILSGLLYLCTGGLSGLGVIYDLIQIIRGRFTDKQGRILKD